MPARADADPYDAVRAAEEAVFALEEEAGIAAQADRARDVFGYDVHSESPFGSLARKRESQEARRYEHEAAARRTRALYFGVADLDLRLRLIAASRNVSSKRHSAATAAVAAARVAVGTAVRDGGPLPYADLIEGAVFAAFIWAAWRWGSTGLALALIAFWAATMPRATATLLARRDMAIRTAQEELAQAEENAEEAYSPSPVFTASEERSGEADARP